MLHDVVLASHIAAGGLGLVVGPVAVRVGRLRPVFHWLVLAVCVSAVALIPFDWSGLWFFLPISLASYAFAFAGFVAGTNRGVLLRGYGGAYIALWTAVLVVSAPDAPVTWVVPALAGVPMIELSAR